MPRTPRIAYKARDSKRGGKQRERDTDSKGDMRTADAKGSDLTRKWSFWTWPVKGGLDFRFRMGKEIRPEYTTCIFREWQRKSQENVIQRHSKEEKLKDGFEIECYKILKYKSEKINPSPLFWDLRLFSENQAWLAGKELVRGNLDPKNTQVWPL